MTELKNIMFCATAFAPSLLGAKELPNIIYIVTDQQTASAMSCMGNTDVHTPNMDRLAQAGILFKKCLLLRSVKRSFQGIHVYRTYFPRSRTLPKQRSYGRFFAYCQFRLVNATCRL